jgi:hypothetical protein
MFRSLLVHCKLLDIRLVVQSLVVSALIQIRSSIRQNMK